MPPAWLTGIFAATILAVAAISAARLVAARPERRDPIAAQTDSARLLTVIAMAGMLVPGLATLPKVAWTVVFGLVTAWFAYQVAREARDNGIRALAGEGSAATLAHGLAHCAALLYMFLAETGQAGNSPVLSQPTFAFAFTLILIGLSIRDLDQLANIRDRPAGLAAVTVAGTSMPVLAGTGLPTLAAAGAGAPWADAPFPGAPFPGEPFAGASLPDAPLPRVPFADAPGGYRTIAFRSAGRHAAGRTPAHATRAAGGAELTRVLLGPRTTVASRIVISVTMTLLLVLMI
jgi:hypothetical protein